MNYATIKYNDIANGEGVRTSLFVSGCRHHCKGCFNSETWDFKYGNPFTDKEKDSIIKSLELKYISGLTLLGGEPLDKDNQFEVWDLIKRVRSNSKLNSKTIWVYTGYIYPNDFNTEASRAYTKVINDIFNNIDVLVDGPFIQSLKDISLRFRGSSNQRIININKRGLIVTP